MCVCYVYVSVSAGSQAPPLLTASIPTGWTGPRTTSGDDGNIIHNDIHDNVMMATLLVAVIDIVIFVIVVVVVVIVEHFIYHRY